MRVIMSMNVLMPSWSYLLLMSNVLFIHSLVLRVSQDFPQGAAAKVRAERARLFVRYLLEVRRGRRSQPPPNAWLLQLIAAHNSLAHLQLLGR